MRVQSSVAWVGAVLGAEHQPQVAARYTFTLSQLYGRKYLEKYLVIYGLLDLNVTKSTTQIYLSHVDEQYIEISREYLESIYS